MQAALASTLFVVAFSLLLILLYRLTPPPRTNILILGIDARPGEGSVARTDVMILATVNPGQPYVGMLSIPRDLYVSIPGYGSQRINAAHVYAEADTPGTGPQLAIQTVEQNFGVRVDRYLRINFEGFVAIVDAAGGVTVNVEHYFIDYEYPTSDYGTMVVEFQPGQQLMDGERALQYARSRHGSSDIERSHRQQQIIQALLKQLLWPSHWTRWPAVYRAFRQHVDTNLTLIDTAALVPAVLWVGPDGLDRRVFDETMAYGRTTDAGAYVREPIWDGIGPVIDEMFRR